MPQVEHGAGPDAGVTGIGYQDGIGGQMLAQFAAEPFGAHRQGIRVDIGADIGFPFRHQTPDRVDPILSRWRFARAGDHLPQCGADIAVQTDGGGIVAADLLGIDIELDDARSGGRNAVVMGNLAAAMTADEKDQVGLSENLVGAGARIGTGHTDRQWVISREHGFGVERRGDGNRESFPPAPVIRRGRRKR